MKFSNLFKVALLFLFVRFSLNAQNSYWTLNTDEETKIGKRSTQNNINLDKEKYQIFTLDVDAFKSELKKGVTSKSSPVISFPNQYGELETFSVVETHVLAPHVAVKFPNIKTYIGYGIDNPGSRIRFSVSPQGVQTMTSYVDKPVVFTVPQGKNTTSYISYDKSARKEYVKDFQCLTDDLTSNNGDSNRGLVSRPPNDQILRTFRLAVSTTSEYTARWDDGNDGNGDAKADALAQIVSTVNRMNEVFELDMAITFQLVTGTEVVFDDAVSDPYTVNLNDEVQSALTTNVGEANYDIGHLFHQGVNNGNAGCLGCVCEDGRKGSGFSSHSFAPDIDGPYMTDYFDLDFVLHEVGHQMGGNHTWSFRSEGTGMNVEPGSGTTIMGYAGFAGLNDVQLHSDPYFHYSSVEQILNNILGSPNNCWTSTPIVNVAPVANAGNDYTIPAGTAFILKGSATTTSRSSNIRYIWEQIDDGVSTSKNFGPTKTDGAIFRSRPPSTNPNRYMPTLSRIIAGKLTEENPRVTVLNDSWETVSTVTRQLNFALTVRDQLKARGNLPQTDSDLMRILVFDTAGPFVVTSQATAVTWTEGETKTVAWDVAGTDTGNVNTPTVNILLSIDGGNTYPYTLASNVANDGSHDIIVPTISAMSVSNARVMVEGNGNIFFALNSSDFTVQNVTASVGEDALSSFSMFPNPSNGLFNISFDTTDRDVSIQVSDLKGAVIKILNYRDVGGRFSEKVELNAISRGLYILRITNGENSVTKKIIIE